MRSGWLLVSLLAMGCGGGSSLTPEQFSVKGRALTCDFEVRCCQQVTGAVVYADVASCEAATQTGERLRVEAQITAGKKRFDSGKANECLAQFESGIKSCSKTFTGALTPACAEVAVGTVKLGGSCANDDYDVCAPGLACDGTVCQNFVAVGGVCDNADHTLVVSCDDNSYCDYGATMKCVAQAANGSACTQDLDCQSFTCDSSMKCAAPPSESVTVVCESMPQT